MSKMPIRLRKATEEDIPFIFNSWLKSYRKSEFAKDITATVYFSEHHKVLRRLIDTSQVIIACNQDSPDQIYGWICAGMTDGIFTLHYLYIKKPFRNFGIAKNLLNAFEHDPTFASVCTHVTRHGSKLASKYNFVYHPYIAFPEVKESSNE